MAPPAGGAIRDKGRAELSGPCRLADLPDDRLVPAAAEACVGRRPVAADRAFARRHPAADPARIALLRLARLRLVRIVHILSPACWLPQRARTLTRGTAESCDAKRPIARAKLAPISRRQFSPKFRRGLRAGSHPLVSTIVVDERGTVGPGAHRF